MTIRFLKTFVAVASEGSFAAAAGKLGLTQSAVSLQMKALEEEFRTELFERTRCEFSGRCSFDPDLIYCSITGFGQSGPMAPRAGYDAMVQGMGGIMSITGEADGSPMKVGVGISDLMTGMYAGMAILAALRPLNHATSGWPDWSAPTCHPGPSMTLRKPSMNLRRKRAKCM